MTETNRFKSGSFSHSYSSGGSKNHGVHFWIKNKNTYLRLYLTGKYGHKKNQKQVFVCFGNLDDDNFRINFPICSLRKRDRLIGIQIFVSDWDTETKTRFRPSEKTAFAVLSRVADYTKKICSFLGSTH